ncbi:MAG: DUF167 domain-containing protein [Acidobacteriaceae bacterium]
MSPQAEEMRNRLFRDGSLLLEVKAVPHARSSEVSELMANGSLKIKVVAAPEKGKANEEVCAVLAAYLNVPKRNVEVVLGHASRQKRVRILASSRSK